MPDIRIQVGSVRHLESGSVANMKNAVAFPLASPRGASEPESTLASTRSMHPLRMQPPNWNELFAFKAQGASPPPPAALEEQLDAPLSPLGEQTEPPSTLLEVQTEADLKELVPTNLRPIKPTSTSSEVPYGWKALNSCVGWGRHFRGFEVNEKVTFPLRPTTHVEVIVTPPSPPLLSWVSGRTHVSPCVGFENTSPPPSPLSSVKPQFIKSHLVDGEFTDRYRGSNGKGLPPRTYEQQLDLKTSQSTHIRLLKGNQIPEHAYLKVPQSCQLSKVHPQGLQLERALTKDCCDARSKKEALGTQMATGGAPETPTTLVPTNTLPACPKTPKTRISVGQVLELQTLETRTNTTARPHSYHRYYNCQPAPRIILSGNKAREIAPTNVLSERRWSFEFGVPDVLDVARMMTSALTLAEAGPPVINNTLPLNTPTSSTHPIDMHHPYSWPPSAPTTPRSPRSPGIRDSTFEDLDRMVAFHKDRRLSLVLRASERGDAVAELREMERTLGRLVSKRGQLFMARVATGMLEARR
jgi:hypothetical protein